MSQTGVPISSAAQAGAFLEGLINFEREPGFRYERMGLDPVRALLDELGNPHRNLSIVHIAGSKGKGSTALLVEHLLGALGERVGTFTSPHLVSWTERFRIGGRDVDGQRLAAAVERVRGPVERLRSGEPGLRPTFFDATTAAALVLFESAGVDRVVLEVGLGGRLDSTNAVDPALTCITTIELEHTDKLGQTLAAIAAEKAGILKPGVPGVVGRLPAEALEVVVRRADEVGAPLWILGRDFEVSASRAAGLSDAPGAAEHPTVRLAYRDRGGLALEAALPLLGGHQIDNAGLAIACLRRLWNDDGGASVRRAASQLATVRLPGRVELMGQRPGRVVDGAHTAASARALAAAIAPLPGRRHWVLSISEGKDLGAILDALLQDACSVTVTRAEPRRSLDPTVLAAAVAERIPEASVRIEPDPARAVREACAGAAPTDLVVATGSVYLAGIARSAWADAPDAPAPGPPGPAVVTARGPRP